MGLSVERIHAMYQRMLLMRAFDEHAGTARRDNRLRGSVHEYTGQEAIAAGVCAAGGTGPPPAAHRRSSATWRAAWRRSPCVMQAHRRVLK